MKRRLSVGFAIVGAVVTILLVTRGAPRRSEALAAPADPSQRMLIRSLLGPDTTGTDWKRLSRDVALELSDDAYYGLRARLFVRVNGRWLPVGIDNPSDVAQFVPAR